MEVSGLGLDADAFGGRIENLNAKKDEVDLRCEVRMFKPFALCTSLPAFKQKQGLGQAPPETIPSPWGEGHENP